MPDAPIVGPATGTKEAVLAFARHHGAKRWSEVEAFVDELFTLAQACGYDPFMIAAQSAVETGLDGVGGGWRSPYWENHLNPGGIGITHLGAPSHTWTNGRDAARAMLVHHAAYLGGSVPPNLAPYVGLDPRFTDATVRVRQHGMVHTWRDYGNGNWAVDPNYFVAITARAAAIRRFEPIKPSHDNRKETDMPVPKIYDLRNDADAQRFGLSLAGRNEILTHKFVNRYDPNSGVTGRPTHIVLHIQDGSTPGSLTHWTGVEASSTVMIQRDGSILKVIAEADGPWTNGDVKSPTTQSAGLRNQGGNPNIWSLTIEAEGRPEDAMPQAELDATIWQVKSWQSQYGISDDKVLPHASINSVSRANCPGTYYNRVIKAITGVEPEVDAAPYRYPTGMDKGIAELLFGEVKKDGKTYKFGEKGSPVSLLWLSEGRQTGVFPRLADVRTFDTRTYFLFENGLTIWRPNDSEPVRVLRAG